MQLSPILPGNLPNSLIGTLLSDQMQSQNTSLVTLQNQITTGQQFSIPSQSPVAAIQTIDLQKSLSQQTLAMGNIQTDQTLMQATDNALSTVTTALNSANSLLLQGIGTTATASQKQALATQVGSLITQLLNTANTQVQGSYIFGGTDTSNPPFVQNSDGTVTYNGNEQGIQSLIGSNTLFTNNVDGNTAFGALSPPVGSNLNPALTANTNVSDLFGGKGASLGQVTVTLDNGGTPQTATVDLSHAQTIGDVETDLQNAFSGGPLTLSVSIDPATNSGLLLQSSAGTVSVADVNGGTTASQLGISSAATATIHGGNLSPRLTLETDLSALNGGAGVSTTGGLVITNGSQSATIDLSSATTVQDVINQIQQANLGLNVQINSAGNGLAISSRVSGANFSIGENGGTTATDLGIRTMTGATPLSSLNSGSGVPVSDGIPLQITRRDGSTTSVDISGATTVQDVINAINQADPGNLVASLDTVGSGIQITDNSGTGPLTVAGTNSAVALGIAGSETGNNPATPLVGTDANPQTTQGVFDILTRLQTALNNGDNQTLQQLSGQLTQVQNQTALVQGNVGSSLQLLTATNTNLQNQTLQTKQSLSNVFDTDMATAATQFAQLQTTMQATLQVAAQTLQMSIFKYI